MAERNDYSTTAASNTARWPEGMARNAVNNAGRENEAISARDYKDNDGSLTLGGTATAYTVTLNSQHAAWFTGLSWVAKANVTSGATPTVNPTGSAALGAKSMYMADGTQITTGHLVSGGLYKFTYDGTNVQVVNLPAAPVVAASETVAGKVELATQAEVNTGTDTARAVTPAGLTGWTPGAGTVTAVNADKVLLADASASGVLKQALVSDIVTLARPAYIAIEDQKADGTGGDALTANAWTKHTLNTEVVDSGGNASVASSVVTLEAGTYELIAFILRSHASGARLRFRNTTDTVTLAGPSMSWQLGTITDTSVGAPVLLFGRFTLAAQKTCELQYYSNVTNAVAADRTTSGEVEVYAGLYLAKVV